MISLALQVARHFLVPGTDRFLPDLKKDSVIINMNHLSEESTGKTIRKQHFKQNHFTIKICILSLVCGIHLIISALNHQVMM